MPPPIGYGLAGYHHPRPIAVEVNEFHTAGTASSRPEFIASNDEENFCRGWWTEESAIDAAAASDMNINDYQTPYVRTPWHEASPSDQTRWNALPYQNNALSDRITIDGEFLMGPCWVHVNKEEADGHSFFNRHGDYSENRPCNERRVSGDECDGESKSQFAVTDEELELLDYAGTRGRRRGNDALYSCTGRAASLDRKTGSEVRSLEESRPERVSLFCKSVC